MSIYGGKRSLTTCSGTAHPTLSSTLRSSSTTTITAATTATAATLGSSATSRATQPRRRRAVVLHNPLVRPAAVPHTPPCKPPHMYTVCISQGGVSL